MTDALTPGFHPLPPGHLSTVVTYLELQGPPKPRPAPAPRAKLVAMPAPGLDWYRGLFRHVGAPWLWTSRLLMGDDQLGAILGHRQVEVYAVRAGGRDEGLLELDFRSDVPELAFFGLSAALQGQGAGRWLMNQALERLFARADRVTVHTCTLDHPAALAFYQRTGFEIIRQEVEVMPDPRLTGVLPREMAPHVPLAISGAAG